VAVTLKQNGDIPTCGATPTGVYCASSTLGDSPENIEVSSDGSDTTTYTANLGNKQADRAEIFIEYDADAASYNGASGNWVVRLEVTVAANMTWEECYVCHLDGGCGGSATSIASATGLGVSMNSTGVKSSGNLSQGSSQTIDSGDIIMIVCSFTYGTTGGLACTLRVDPTDGVTAPGAEVVVLPDLPHVNMAKYRPGGWR